MISENELLALFEEWRADIDSEPYPEMPELQAAIALLGDN